MLPSPSQRYRELVAAHAVDEVAFGAGTVHLTNADELSDAQVGYAVGPTGESLVGESDGDWQAEWLVVGYEGLTGDPLFVDTSEEDWPVYTAMHGEGAWEPDRIADSFMGFLEALQLVRNAGLGRDNPVALEANPLPARDAERILAEIRRRNPESSPDFWTIWLTEQE